MAFQFGSGVVWLSPVGGNQATNPTPKELGTIESASCEFTGTLKELIGFNQFPDDVAVGEKKVSGKIVMGRIDASTFNNVFFADTVVANQSTNDQYNEKHTIPGSPYNITAAPPTGGTATITSVAITTNVLTILAVNTFQVGDQITFSGVGTATFLNGQTVTILTRSGTQFTASFTHADYGPTVDTGTATAAQGVYLTDLGVIFASGANAGKRLEKVTGTPATGQYARSGAVYTFAAADTTLDVWISYQFTMTVGSTFQINNQVMGYGPILAVDLLWGYQSGYTGVANALGIHLYNARVSKLSMGAKNTDYVKPEMDFSAFANAAGQVGYFIQNVP
jgi:hypothetical protein